MNIVKKYLISLLFVLSAGSIGQSISAAAAASSSAPAHYAALDPVRFNRWLVMDVKAWKAEIEKMSLSDANIGTFFDKLHARDDDESTDFFTQLFLEGEVKDRNEKIEFALPKIHAAIKVGQFQGDLEDLMEYAADASLGISEKNCKRLSIIQNLSRPVMASSVAAKPLEKKSDPVPLFQMISHNQYYSMPVGNALALFEKLFTESNITPKNDTFQGLKIMDLVLGYFEINFMRHNLNNEVLNRTVAFLIEKGFQGNWKKIQTLALLSACIHSDESVLTALSDKIIATGDTHYFDFNHIDPILQNRIESTRDNALTFCLQSENPEAIFPLIDVVGYYPNSSQIVNHQNNETQCALSLLLRACPFREREQYQRATETLVMFANLNLIIQQDDEDTDTLEKCSLYEYLQLMDNMRNIDAVDKIVFRIIKSYHDQGFTHSHVSSSSQSASSSSSASALATAVTGNVTRAVLTSALSESESAVGPDTSAEEVQYDSELKSSSSAAASGESLVKSKKRKPRKKTKATVGLTPIEQVQRKAQKEKKERDRQERSEKNKRTEEEQKARRAQFGRVMHEMRQYESKHESQRIQEETKLRIQNQNQARQLVDAEQKERIAQRAAEINEAIKQENLEREQNIKLARQMAEDERARRIQEKRDAELQALHGMNHLGDDEEYDQFIHAINNAPHEQPAAQIKLPHAIDTLQDEEAYEEFMREIRQSGSTHAALQEEEKKSDAHRMAERARLRETQRIIADVAHIPQEQRHRENAAIVEKAELSGNHQFATLLRGLFNMPTLVSAAIAPSSSATPASSLSMSSSSASSATLSSSISSTSYAHVQSEMKERDAHRLSPLIHSAQQGNIRAVERLTRDSRTINLQDLETAWIETRDYNVKALLVERAVQSRRFCAQWTNKEFLFSYARTIIKKGEDDFVILAPGTFTRLRLFEKVASRIARLYHVDECVEHEDTLLKMAIRSKQPAMLVTLIKAGANPAPLRPYPSMIRQCMKLFMQTTRLKPETRKLAIMYLNKK